MKYCEECGKELEDYIEYCPVCGAKQPVQSYDAADAFLAEHDMASKGAINSYTEAVALAKAGDNRGFEYLYNMTYKDKKFIALKYMKNNDDAEDVLQDAYMKMLTKLDTLAEPEKFPGWFSFIVANTAKDALKKKNPVLFSQLEQENSEGEAMELEFEEEAVSVQPELAYSQKETQDLVREMMAALSDEQRVCVMMYYIEGMGVREIAETLECSENTVKSRLNYARKNIKAQGEELQRKGYQLYGMAPLPLLLYLIRMEAAFSGARVSTAAGIAVTGATGVPGVAAAGVISNSGMAVGGAVGAPGMMAAGGAIGAPGMMAAGGAVGTSGMATGGAAGTPGMVASGAFGQAPAMMMADAANQAQAAISTGTAQAAQAQTVIGAGAGQAVTTGQVAQNVAVSGSAKGFFATVGGKVAAGVAATAIVAGLGVGAYKMIHKDNDKQSEPTTEITVETDTDASDSDASGIITTELAEVSTEATNEITTEATTEEVKTNREIFEEYVEGLIKEYGEVLPEQKGKLDLYMEGARTQFYTTSESWLNLQGIIRTDIFDYDGDGEEELLVIRGEHISSEFEHVIPDMIMKQKHSNGAIKESNQCILLEIFECKNGEPVAADSVHIPNAYCDVQHMMLAEYIYKVENEGHTYIAYDNESYTGEEEHSKKNIAYEYVGEKLLPVMDYSAEYSNYGDLEAEFVWYENGEESNRKPYSFNGDGWGSDDNYTDSYWNARSEYIDYFAEIGITVSTVADGCDIEKVSNTEMLAKLDIYIPKDGPEFENVIVYDDLVKAGKMFIVAKMDNYKEPVENNNPEVDATEDVRDIYQSYLKGEIECEYSDGTTSKVNAEWFDEEYVSEVQYFYRDLDNDGAEEMIVQLICADYNDYFGYNFGAYGSTGGYIYDVNADKLKCLPVGAIAEGSAGSTIINENYICWTDIGHQSRAEYAVYSYAPDGSFVYVCRLKHEFPEAGNEGVVEAYYKNDVEIDKAEYDELFNQYIEGDDEIAWVTF